MFWNVLECSTVAIYIVRGYGQGRTLLVIKSCC